MAKTAEKAKCTWGTCAFRKEHSPRHVFRTSAAELVRMTDGEVADVKEC